MMMESEWRTKKLGELVVFKTGKLDSNASVPDGDYPFFTCSQETFRTNTFSFDVECVVLAGNNANGIFPLKYFHGKFDAYQRTYVITTRDASRLNIKFLYYALRLKLSEFRSFATGAATKFLTMTILNDTEIVVPPLPVQRRIAGILSAYDELIENSQRRIRLLEDIARALYREWFVHFRFPRDPSEALAKEDGHESIPRLPSALGDIPQGWEVKLVKDILARRSAGSVYRELDVKQEGAIPVLDQSTNELLGFHDNEADHVASPESPLAIFGDHTCKMQLLIEPFSVGPNVVPFASDAGLPTAYVFYVVSSLVQTQEYKRHWIPLNAKEVVVADSTIAQRFASLIQPMLIEQATLSKVIRNLRRTRDLLLPRLLSGQVALDSSLNSTHDAA